MSHFPSAFPIPESLTAESATVWSWQLLLALFTLLAVCFLPGHNSVAGLALWGAVYGASSCGDRQLTLFSLAAVIFLFEATRLETGYLSITEVVLLVVGLRIVLGEGPAKLLKLVLHADLQDKILLGFLGLVALSLFWVITGHGNSSDALKSAVRYAEYAIAYLCFGRLTKDQRELQALEFFLVLVAAVFALVGIYQHFAGPYATSQMFPLRTDTSDIDPESFRIYSVFSNPIYLSAFCSFFVPFTLDRVLDRRFSHRWTYAFCCFLVSVALLLTSSRTGMLGAAVGLLVIGGRSIKRLVVLAALVMLLVTVFSTESLEDRLAQTGSQGDLTAAIRVLKYYRTAVVIAQNPIVGVGTGQYEDYFLAEIAPNLPKEGYGELTAENTLLQIGAELGLPGMLVLSALIITVLLRSYRLMKWKIPGGRGLFAGLCAFEVSNMFASMTAVSLVLFTLLLYVVVKRNYELLTSA